MSVANNKIFIFYLLSAILFASACQNQKHESHETYNSDLFLAERFLRYELALSLETYNNRLEECEEIEKTGSKPNVDNEMLNKLGFSQREVMLALVHLSIKNIQKCVQPFRGNVAYNLGRYKKFIRDNKINSADIDFQNMDGIPGMDQFQQYDPKSPSLVNFAEIIFDPESTLTSILPEIEYMNLSYPKRAYIEKAADNKIFNPFSIIDNLKTNKSE